METPGHTQFYKLILLIIGNISKWIYFGGKKSIDEISKEDNLILGLIVSIILGVILFLIYKESLFDSFTKL